jgi:DNA-binding NarL/FixJ family response regulator
MNGEQIGKASEPTGRRSAGGLPGAPAGRTAAPLRLLVVDDHPAVRLGLVKLLEEQGGFTVVSVAETAERAVAEAERKQIDVAIVDYHLGGRNGLWVSRTLKRSPQPPGVIVFSAYASDHLGANCAVAHADGLLNKGALGSELCDAVRAVTHGRRLLPKVPPALFATLSRRLHESEQLLFGMLLAGLPVGEIRQILGLSPEELAALEDAILFELEALPGEDGDVRLRARARPRGADAEPERARPPVPLAR